MGTKVDKEAALTYGCYVADTNQKMLHYAEHPESYISDTINAGVYVFSHNILNKEFVVSSQPDAHLNLSGSVLAPELDEGVISMERDLLPTLVNEGKVGVFEYTGFWRSIKNAGGAVFANEQFMNWYAKSDPNFVHKTANFEICGNIIVHPSAQIDATAKLGPNVYIGPNVKIGGGARVHNSIILDNVVIKEHACVMYSIIGEDSGIGAWSRIEGLPTATAAVEEGKDTRFRRLGITVFGKGVTAGPEIIIRNCIILPHKSLKSSVSHEIIL
jgi:mannose-1-phosphate guanylyltransferase